MKKSILTLALAGILTVGGTVMAFAEELEPMRGNRNNGTTGVQQLINDGATFEEAKAIKLEEKFERVDAAVENGTISAERAVEIKDEMEAKSAECTTPGERACDGEGYGLNQGLNGNGKCDGTGVGKGNKNGSGMSQGKGQGKGKGNGMGLGNGSCAVTE